MAFHLISSEKDMCEIETDRLQLRMFRADDLDELSTIFADPVVVRHIGSGKPACREETAMALQSIIRHWERHGFGRWAVVYKRMQKLIGYCGLRSFNGTPELVYLLSKEFWGKGLATEMARAALKYGFEHRQFERVIAMAKVANVASQRVMEKLGMTYERNENVCGMDVVCYSISSADYFSGQSNQVYTFGNSISDVESSTQFSTFKNPAPPAPSSPEPEAKTASQ